MLKRTHHSGTRHGADRLRRGIGLLLLGIQLAGGLGVFGHTHVFALRLVSDPALAAHECGDQERHIPLDSIHPCVICWQLHQRLSLPVESTDFSAVHGVTAGLCTIPIPPVIAGDHLFPEKRGPPAIV
jgi:hypothetical protein